MVLGTPGGHAEQRLRTSAVFVDRSAYRHNYESRGSSFGVVEVEGQMGGMDCCSAFRPASLRCRCFAANIHVHRFRPGSVCLADNVNRAAHGASTAEIGADHRARSPQRDGQT